MAETRKIKNIALVYSGGLARGAIQMAFANEILKKVGYERISVISASSIGAINAYATSVHTVDEMINIYSNIDCDSTGHFMKKIRNDLFNDVFNRIEGPKMTIPVYVTGTRVFGFNCEYFCINHMKREDVKAAINMAMSFPIINGPVAFNHSLYCDGGATDNIPVLPTSYFDPDMIIILHNLPNYYPPADLYEKAKGAIICDIDITLTLGKEYNSFAMTKQDLNEMLRVGSIAGKEFASFVFEDFNKENVQQRVYEYIEKNKPLRRNKRGDALMRFVKTLNVLYTMKESIV